MLQLILFPAAWRLRNSSAQSKQNQKPHKGHLPCLHPPKELQPSQAVLLLNNQSLSLNPSLPFAEMPPPKSSSCGRKPWPAGLAMPSPEQQVPCLLQAMSSGGAFLSTVLSTSTWYRNSATSFTSRWKATLSTTNTMALGQEGGTGAEGEAQQSPCPASIPAWAEISTLGLTQPMCWLKCTPWPGLQQEFLPCLPQHTPHPPDLPAALQAQVSRKFMV